MHTRLFSRLGAQVSEIGLGCWQLGGDFGAIDEARAEAILWRAIERGVTFFDTADVYGAGRSESLVGRVLRAAGRGRFTIASKVGRGAGLYPDGYTRAAVRASVEGSLKRLGVETLDLIQLHCVPHAVLKRDEIFDWLRELQSEGKVRAFGASVETVEEGFTSLRHADLASLQVIFNLFRQRPAEDLFGEAKRRGVAIIVRLPLNSGLLSGKMSRARILRRKIIAITTATVRRSAWARPLGESRSTWASIW
jgi:aryl-alcohol dehydrogenase-like predicted oxidoreductase